MPSNVEEKIALLFDKKHALFTKSGTVAIWLALEALGLKGKKIIVPANVCFVVVSAIMMSGNEPYFVDIGKDFTINADDLNKISDGKVAAVIFPHMYGNTGDILGVAAIAKKKNWIVIEDVAPALGAKIGNKYAGSFSDISITSFGIGKVIDLNIGGMLCVNSKSLYDDAKNIYDSLPLYDEKMRALIYETYPPLYWRAIEGLEQNRDNSEFGNMVAKQFKDALISRSLPGDAFLMELEKAFDNLKTETEIRTERAKYFQSTIKNINIEVVPHNEGATYWRQNILVKNKRDMLLDYLKNNGIKAQKHFPSIDRLVFKRKDEEYKKSDLIASRIINLWPGRETSFEDIKKINELINSFYAGSIKGN